MLEQVVTLIFKERTFDALLLIIVYYVATEQMGQVCRRFWL